MERRFNIVPNADIYSAVGEDAGDALVNFAGNMDGDMNVYFRSEEDTNVICPYDSQEAVIKIEEYAMRNKISLSECISIVEIRGLTLSETAEVIEKVNLLIKSSMSD